MEPTINQNNIQEIQVRLEVLRLAKDMVEVNSLAEAGEPGPRGQARIVPRYSVDTVLLTARRLYDFVTADQAKTEQEKAAA